MALSEFSFKVQHIAGKGNSNMVDFPRDYPTSAILYASIITKFKLSPFKFATISSVHNSNCGHYGLERTLLRLKAIKKVWQF